MSLLQEQRELKDFLREKSNQNITGQDFGIFNILNLGSKKNKRLFMQTSRKDTISSLYRQKINTDIKARLDKVYPLTKKVINKAWEDICEDYIPTIQNYSFIADNNVELFSNFIKLFKIKIKYNFLPPWLFELAEYEWHSYNLYHATELKIRKKVQGFNLFFVNALKIFKFNYPISNIIHYVETSNSLASIRNFSKRNEHIVLFRTKLDQVKHISLTEGSYFIIMEILKGTNRETLINKFQNKFKLKPQARDQIAQKIFELVNSFAQHGLLAEIT